MIAAVVSLTMMGMGIGFLLGFAAKHFRVETNPLVEEINSLLPASNCGQCGYPGCSSAAEALVKGDALVTLCPPGGKLLAEQIADRLGVEANLSNMEDKGPLLAFVREETCVGCTRCFKACPTDAIIGAPKMLHTVIPSACTGCGACVDICPTECLVLNEIPETLSTWRWHKPVPMVQGDLAAA